MKSIPTLLLCLFALTAYGADKEIRLSNSRLAVVAKAQEAKLEIQYPFNSQWVKAGELTPIGPAEDAIQGVSAALAIDKSLTATFTTKSGQKMDLIFALKDEAPLLEVRPGVGVEKLRVRFQAKCPFAIQPDLRANDLVFDARQITGSLVYPPSENCLLNLIEGGNAFVMFLWSSPRQQVRMAVENKRFTATEVGFTNANPVWIGVPAAAGIWHVADTAKLSDMEDRALAWKVPFPARWVADYPRTNGLTETFGNGTLTGGQFNATGVAVTNPANHTSWISPRGGFLYPFYTEGQKAFIRIPKFSDHEEITYRPNEPILIYPFEKVAETPAGIYTPLDLIRLAFENTSSAELYKLLPIKANPRIIYSATCGVTSTTEQFYDAKEEVKKRADIERMIHSTDMFVLSIRQRIEEYVVWSKMMHQYFANRTAAHPELKDLAAEMTKRLSRIENRYAHLKKDMKFPTDEQALSRQMVQLIDSKDPKKVDTVKDLGRQIRTIGGSQDWLCADSRQVLSEMRQQAGILMSTEVSGPKRAFLQEIRDRVFEFTSMTFGHESGLEGSRRN